jgi:hypothetical protein
MLEFLGTLSESRLFPSVSHLRQYRADELSELAVLYICGLYVLFRNKSTEKFAASYARQTVQYGTNFSKWHSGSSDLYVLLHALEAPGVQLDDEDDSNDFKKHLAIPATLNQWLKDMAHGFLPKTHRTMFARLDSDFRIHNSSIRAVRRMAADWDHLDQHERQLTMTRLLQLMKNRAPKGELLPKLQMMAQHNNLELRNACDKDTGVCGPQGALDAIEDHPKKPSLLSTLALIAAGAAVANAFSKKDKK